MFAFYEGFCISLMNIFPARAFYMSILKIITLVFYLLELYFSYNIDIVVAIVAIII